MLRDLIYLSSFYLNLDEVTDYLNSLTDETPLTKPNDVDKLIGLANLTIRKVVREFAPLYSEENCSSNSNCEISYSSLTNDVCNIKSVSTPDGLNSTFRVFPEYIKVGRPNNAYSVCYSFYPTELTELSDNLVLPVGVTKEAISFGMCAEYLTISGMFDEADMFEAKFKESLADGLIHQRERKVLNRGWI